MSNCFADIAGQGPVVSYLQSALACGRVTHAYLIAGADAATRNAVALDFAAALIAGDDAEEARQVRAHAHPDLHLLAPAGVAGYLADQVREVVRDAELAPIRAPRKVYVLERCERLAASAANAFLKTLEEPPSDVVCILLASTEASVLETLRSRCEVLVLNEAAQPHDADAALLELMAGLARGCDNRTLLVRAKGVAEAAKASAVCIGQRQEAALEDAEDYLSAGARREIEQRNKREASAAERSALLESVAVCRSWLRDCLLVQQGAPELASCPGASAEVGSCAASVDVRGLLDALEATRVAETRISYNVTPQLAIEAMCIEIREALCRQ